MRCKTCHYSLQNLTGPPHRCPECGNPFDPNDPNTYEIPRQRQWRALVWSAFISAVLVFILVIYAAEGIPEFPIPRFAFLMMAIGWVFLFVVLLLIYKLYEINLHPWLIWLRSKRR